MGQETTMNKQEIINYVINKTNWQMMIELRTIACKHDDLDSNHLNNEEELKRIGANLLSDVIDNNYDYCSTAMLTAYKHEESGYEEYGLKFETETIDAVAYVEVDEWDDLIQ